MPSRPGEAKSDTITAIGVMDDSDDTTHCSVDGTWSAQNPGEHCVLGRKQGGGEA